MRNGGLDLLLVLTVILALGTIIQDYRFESSIARERAAATAIDRQLGSLDVAVAELAAAGTGAIADPTNDAWSRRVSDQVVRGPSTPYVTDSYAFAQTSPVYVVRDGRPYASAADARFMGEAVEALRTSQQFTKWRSTADSAAFHKALEQAREVYRQIEQRNSSVQSRSQ